MSLARHCDARPDDFSKDAELPQWQGLYGRPRANTCGERGNWRVHEETRGNVKEGNSISARVESIR